MSLVNLRLHLLLVVLVVNNAIGVDLSKYSVVHYSDENGLPQNSIKGIAESAEGFIWLATESGLVRFDGQRFYTFDKSKLPIKGNRMVGFIPTPAHSKNGPEFLALAENHQHIEILNNGTAAVNNLHLNVYRSKFPVRVKWSQELDITISHPSFLVAGYPNHAPYFFKGDNATYYMWLNGSVETYEDQKIIATADIILREFFLIGSKGYGRLPNGQFVRIKGASIDTITVTDGLGQTIGPYELLNSRLFWDCISNRAYLYYDKNLYKLTPSNDGSNLIANVILEDIDLDSLNVQCVYDNGRGTILLGSRNSGLYVLTQKVFRTTVSRQSKADNVFYAQLPPLLNRTIGKSSTFELAGLLSGVNKNYLAKNPDGTFWMAEGSSLIRFSRDAFKIEERIEFSRQIQAIYRDSLNALWVGGIEDTLFVAGQSSGRPNFRVAAKGSFGEIICMSRVSPDQLMFGTKKGLFLLTISNGKLSSFPQLASFQVRSLLRSGKSVWVTTEADGIYRINGNRVTKLPLAKAQYLMTSHCIMEDKSGYLWITTNKGLFKALKSDLEKCTGANDEVFYLHYDKSYGFNTNEFNGGCQPCGVIGNDGLFYLPSMDGVVFFDPTSFQAEVPNRNIFISHIKVDDQLLSSNTPVLPRTFKEIEIGLTIPYFGSSNNLNIYYSFTRSGQDTTWLLAPSDLIIRRPNLGPGTYYLHAKKVDNFGLASRIITLGKIRIEPAWYETIWFEGALALLVIIIFGIILNKRSKYLVNEQKRKSIYRHYQLSSRVVTAISHDIQTPLHYVSIRLQQIQNQGTDVQPKLEDEIVDTIERTRIHTANLLHYIKSHWKNDTDAFEMERLDLLETISSSVRLLTGMATYREVVITNLVPPNIILKTQPHLFSIIIHNTLDNAIKFSDSTVTIAFFKNSDQRSLSIHNPGEAMSESTFKWLNRRYDTYDEWLLDFNYPEKGLGLLIIKDLCILLDITLDVISTENGTSFTFTFPNIYKF